jgi:putative transposase
MIDCADRMALAWRLGKRITAEDLAERLREAVFRRFGEARGRAQGIEFLSNHAPEYTSHRFQPLVRALGLIPGHTPRRSPESNGLGEAFFGSFKRDYVYQACLETLTEVKRQLPEQIEHYNQQAPHSALGMRSPAGSTRNGRSRTRHSRSNIKWSCTSTWDFRSVHIAGKRAEARRGSCPLCI